MKKIALRGALQKLGCTDIELHWNGGPACRDQSGFFTGGGEHGFEKGQTYYISYNPQGGMTGLPCVMFRKARDRKDYGGVHSVNQWTFCNILRGIGYEMSLNAVQSRSTRW